jgi:hypothetical protein
MKKNQNVSVKKDKGTIDSILLILVSILCVILLLGVLDTLNVIQLPDILK